MKKPFHADYRPSEEQRALFPPVSGNTLNGLGDAAPRRPTPLYWFEPETIAHGELQNYFYARAEALSEGRGVSTRDESQRGPAEPAPIAAQIEVSDPVELARRVRAFALANEADLCGIARVREEWVYEGHAVAEPWIVVLGFAMDQRELAKGPPREEDIAAADEVSRQYNRAARACRALANFIRGLGFDAIARTGPWSGDMVLIPPAIEAGLGQLGKHGSIINDEYGASFRLGAVSTVAPLVADAPRDIGVDDACASCQLCTRLCPPGAISDEKQLVRGERKWYVDFDRCIPYFNDTMGCGICIAECPWSLPGVAPTLAAKMLQRRARKQGG